MLESLESIASDLGGIGCKHRISHFKNMTKLNILTHASTMFLLYGYTETAMEAKREAKELIDWAFFAKDEPVKRTGSKTKLNPHRSFKSKNFPTSKVIHVPC